MTRPTTTGKAQDLITFTRSTTGTALAKISYGEELVTNGDFSSDSNWNKNPNWTISNGAAISDGSTSQNINQGTVTSVVNKPYLLSVTLSSLSQGSVTVTFGGAASLNASSTGTHSLLVIPSSSDRIRIYASDYAIASIDNVSIKEVLYDQPDGTLQLFNHPINKPRIEYDAEGNCLGLLVEEGRTNKVLYSEDFTHSSWLKQELTVAPAPVAAPDGTMTATHVVKTGSNAHLVTTSIGSTADRSSIWARTVSGTGTMYLGGTDASTLVTVTEEWQKLDAQAVNIHMYAANFRGLATLTEVYVWGAQLETGSFPTSYIPTSGSAVTRSADVASLAVSEFGYNQDQGTVVMERRFLSNDVSSNSGTDLWEDGTNKISLRKAAYLINVNGAGQANSGYGSPIDYVSFHKIGLAFKPNSVIGSTSGGLSAEDTSAAIPNAVNTIQLNRVDTNASFHINGHIKSVQYYPLRLSNAQLQALTV